MLSLSHSQATRGKPSSFCFPPLLLSFITTEPPFLHLPRTSSFKSSMLPWSGFILRPLRCSYILLTSPALPSRCIPRIPCRRQFHQSAIMSNVSVQLTAPNGRTYTQPIGLFINNEFVASKSGEKLASINPSYEHPLPPTHG